MCIVNFLAVWNKNLALIMKMCLQLEVIWLQRFGGITGWVRLLRNIACWSKAMSGCWGLTTPTR